MIEDKWQIIINARSVESAEALEAEGEFSMVIGEAGKTPRLYAANATLTITNPQSAPMYRGQHR
jgi:hypothetical protein